MLINYAEKIKWASDVTPALCERRSDSPVMLCDQRQQGGGGSPGVGPGCSPRRTTWLPFPVHQLQLPWGNSRYQMFGHLVTVVSCQIQQIRPHLAAQGWQIIAIGYRWKCCMCTAAGEWRVGQRSLQSDKTALLIVNIRISPDFKASLWSWRGASRTLLHRVVNNHEHNKPLSLSSSHIAANTFASLNYKELQYLFQLPQQSSKATRYPGHTAKVRPKSFVLCTPGIKLVKSRVIGINRNYKWLKGQLQFFCC